MNATGNRAIVISGSLAGLFAGTLLRSIGWQVDYERNYSIPPGLIAPAVTQEMRSYADRVLVSPFRKLVAATKEPFVQAILDLGVPQMAFNRIALVGDAAFIPRPHTAASTSKAAANAIALVDALTDHQDVPPAIASWQGDQLALGMRLWRQGQALGEQSQFTCGTERWQGKQ